MLLKNVHVYSFDLGAITLDTATYSRSDLDEEDSEEDPMEVPEENMD